MLIQVTSLIFSPRESVRREPAYESKYDTNQTYGYRHEAGHTSNTDYAAALYIWLDAPIL